MLPGGGGGQMTQEEIANVLIKVVQGDIREIKQDNKDIKASISDSLRRLHERLDELIRQDPVYRKECEGYRERCCARQEGRQDKLMRWGIDIVKLLLAAAGGAAGTKIIGG